MALTKTQIQKAAALLVAAKDKSVLVSESDQHELTLESLEEAYAIQDAVASISWVRKGGRIKAWKVGSSTEEPNPIAAPIPVERVYTSPIIIPSDNFQMIGIEAELAYRFSKDLPKKDKAYTLEEVMSAVEGVFVAIEIVDTRLQSWEHAEKLWQLADNLTTGGLVLGTGVCNTSTYDPRQQKVILQINGIESITRTGSHPMLDPKPLLPWIANHCSNRNGGLQKGDIVTTGSWTGLTFVERGSEVKVEFPGIGEAVVSF